MPLIARGAIIGALVAFAVATCVSGASILASETKPRLAVIHGFGSLDGFVNLLSVALLAHAILSVPLGALGGAIGGYQAGAGGAPRTSGQWIRRGGLVGALIGMAGCTLYSLLAGSVAEVLIVAGTLAGLVSGALVGLWCHRVSPVKQR